MTALQEMDRSWKKVRTYKGMLKKVHYILTILSIFNQIGKFLCDTSTYGIGHKFVREQKGESEKPKFE